MPLFGSAVLSHAQLSGVTADQHHAQLHSGTHRTGQTDTINGIPHHGEVRKSVAQVVNNSATVVNDNAFSFTVSSVGIYFVKLRFRLTQASGAADFKCTFAAASGGAMLMQVKAFQLAGALQTGVSINSSVVMGTTALVTTPAIDDYIVEVTAVIRPNGSEVCNFQWAQRVATVADTTVQIDGSMEISREQ